jgi:hypothetical protein
MADITSVEAIRFVNEVVRPSAEKIRNFKAEIDSAIVTWWAGMNTLIPNNSSPLADGRENDGVSRLTGADINSFMAQLLAAKTAWELSGVPQVIAKPCVRPLEAK